MKRALFGMCCGFFLLGCGNNMIEEGNNSQQGTQNPQNQVEVMSDEIINDIIQSIPSPLEITMLIKEGSVYNREYLNGSEKVSEYTTNYKRSLNLGVYGTDLGYANIYGKTQDAISYLNSVQKLADGLAIGQFFDYHTLKKLAESANNLDSLIQTTTQNFEKINFHLREQKRESLSILLLTGGWVEATYLTTLVYNKTPNQALKEKIGEQKVVLNQILLVLDVYRSKPDFPELINDLRELQKVYDEIEISTRYGEPEMVEKNGELVFVDKSESEIKITDEHIAEITKRIKAIRDKVIS
jgi:hypothetical protein